MRTGDIFTFSRSIFRFRGSFSTASMYVAPREAASRAIIPEPEKKSRKEEPERSPRMAKIDSLILSIAGRMTPPGTFTCLPDKLPPVILNYNALSNSVSSSELTMGLPVTLSPAGLKFSMVLRRSLLLFLNVASFDIINPFPRTEIFPS